MMDKNDPALRINRLRIEPQSGIAFKINQGQILQVIDIAGQQVVDLFCFAKNDIKELLSSGHTTDYNNKIFLSTGDVLYSNRSNPMFTILEDRVGGHIMLYAPCSQEMFEKSYDVSEPHPNCFDNLSANLERFGVRPSQISIPFNIFMHIRITDEGVIEIHTPKSTAGDFITLRAEMDMVVALSACSAGACNNFSWTPIEVEIFGAD
ncbi:DUF1989 domain-containing protein [Chloroflexota bacterium]